MNSEGGYKIFQVSFQKEAESEYPEDHFIGSSISIQWPKCHLKLLEYLFRNVAENLVASMCHFTFKFIVIYIYVCGKIKFQCIMVKLPVSRGPKRKEFGQKLNVTSVFTE